MTIHLRRQDYYDRLGLTEEATAEEIRQAFRRRAKQFHPDINASPEATGAFLAISEAYEVLRDEDRRRAYDDFCVDDPEGTDAEGHAAEGADDEVPAAHPAATVRLRARRPASAWFVGLAFAIGIGGVATFGLSRTGAGGPPPGPETVAAAPVIQLASAEKLAAAVSPVAPAPAASPPAAPTPQSGAKTPPATAAKAAEPLAAASQAPAPVQAGPAPTVAPTPAPAEPMPAMPPMELHAEAPAAMSIHPAPAVAAAAPPPGIPRPVLTPAARVVASARVFPARVFPARVMPARVVPVRVVPVHLASLVPARAIRPVVAYPVVTRPVMASPYQAQAAAQAARARLIAAQAYRARILAWQSYRARAARRWVPAWRGVVRRG